MDDLDFLMKDARMNTASSANCQIRSIFLPMVRKSWGYYLVLPAKAQVRYEGY